MRIDGWAIFMVPLVLSGCLGAYQNADPVFENPTARAITFCETAPGFELPKSAPAVLVLQPTNPTVAEQKLVVAMQTVIKEQGGVLAAGPDASDLVVSIKAEGVSENRQRIERLTQRSRSFGIVSGPGGWVLASGHDTTEIPLMLTESVELALVTIDLFMPVRGESSTGEAFPIRHVWHGTLKIGSQRFSKNTRWWLSYLFQRFGGPDGLTTE